MVKDFKWHRILVRGLDAKAFSDLQARGYMSFEEAFAPTDLDEIKATLEDNDILQVDEERKIRFSHVTFVGDLVRFNIGAESFTPKNYI